jgi:hypothetical protein
MTRVVAAACALALMTLLAAPAGAQEGQQRDVPEPGALTPREVQRLFDAYVLMQAQDALALSDSQYPQFLQRMKALQEVRRRFLSARQSLIQELGRLSGAASGSEWDEARAKERLKSLHDLETRYALELRQAYDAVDQSLELKQQARFRVFEEQMERRKVELLLRARAATRNRQLRTPPSPSPQ